MTSRKKYAVLLSENEIAEIVHCMSIALDNGLGYGHCAPGEGMYTLGEYNRKKLMEKMEKIVNPPPADLRLDDKELEILASAVGAAYRLSNNYGKLPDDTLDAKERWEILKKVQETRDLRKKAKR